ncbi:MAG: acyltransferase [archaeon]|nr:acyltransferase [archaeon]
MSETVPSDSGEQNRRLYSIDVIKGFIIIAVVLLHFIIIVPSDEPRTGNSNLALQALYTGLMLFFIFSGYFFRPEKSSWSQVKKRLIIIGTVTVAGLVILPVIMYVYVTLLGYGTDPMDLPQCFRSLFGNWKIFNIDTNEDFPIFAIHNGYYFLQIMLVSFVLFYPIAVRVVNDDRKLIVAIILLVTGTFVLAEFVGCELPLYSQLAPIATAFMLVGAFLGKHKVIERIEYGELTSKWNLMYLAIAAVVGVVMLVLFEPGVYFDDTIFGDYGGYSAYPYFIICCAFCYIFLSIGVVLNKIPGLRKILSTLGRHTLGILCLHIFVLKLLIAPFYDLVRRYAFPDFAITEKLVIGLIGIAICGILLEYVFPRATAKLREIASRD